MSEKNGNPYGSGKPGRLKNATALATLALQQQAIEMFLSGYTVMEIAKALNRSTFSVRDYIAETRLHLMQKNREHFEQRLALLLEDSLGAITSQTSLLQDQEFMMSAAPERIDAVTRATGMLFDKCFVLLAGWGGRRGNTADEPPTEDVGEAVGGAQN